MKKSNTITIATILIVIAIVYFVLTNPEPSTDKELAECIGKNAVLYVNLGCGHCENQKDIFGENLKYIEVVDCFYNNEECAEAEITAVPTWIINGEKITGLQSIKKLKELTGC